MIRGIHHVAIHTANFDNMVKFYAEACGCLPNGPELRWKDSPLRFTALTQTTIIYSGGTSPAA
jgi:catechol 2,3-dioxygenase-like lactoylglutathione lyase family enzyme